MGSRDIVPGWGFGGEQPPCFIFFLPALLFAEREQQGGLNLFLFSRGFGGEAPITFPCPGLREVKRIQSHGLRPREGKWEGRSRAPPYNPLGPQGPRPLQLAHRIPDRTQPGQLHFYLVVMT